MRVAIAQLSSSPDKKANLEKAKIYIKNAKKKGADFVILPEMFMALTKPCSNQKPSDVAESFDEPFVTGLREAARANQVYVICGLYERVQNNSQNAYNTTVIIDRSGEILYFYRKTHLYDAFNFKESNTIAAGEEAFKSIDTEFGKIGLFVCYEVRFPEVARQLALQGADILFVPAGWVAGNMKEDHWKTLLKARAIENTVFVCASNQVGNIYTGESLIIDPMGVIVASAGEEEELLLADLDLGRIGRVREKLPSVKNRREHLY